MKINREHIKNTFQEYTDRYDSTDPKIKLKIDHTYRVADLCERIAKSLDLLQEDIDLAWLSGCCMTLGGSNSFAVIIHFRMRSRSITQGLRWSCFTRTG